MIPTSRRCWTGRAWAKRREKRITALPIWDIAVQTENRAGLNVCTYAEGVPDPLLRQGDRTQRL